MSSHSPLKKTWCRFTEFIYSLSSISLLFPDAFPVAKWKMWTSSHSHMDFFSIAAGFFPFIVFCSWPCGWHGEMKEPKLTPFSACFPQNDSKDEDYHEIAMFCLHDSFTQPSLQWPLHSKGCWEITSTFIPVRMTKMGRMRRKKRSWDERGKAGKAAVTQRTRG